MPLDLPLKFSNVHYYRVTGKYVYAGDLFIARNNLYFFPEVDMGLQREEVARVVPHDFALWVKAILYLAQRCGGYFSRTEFVKDGLSDEQFREEADTCIERLKMKRRWQSQYEFGKILPLPLHVRTNEISDITLTSFGRLSFSAQSDTHDINIGVFRKRRLQKALWEAGAGRV